MIGHYENIVRSINNANASNAPELDLSGFGLRDQDMNEIVQLLLEHSPNITRLDLSRNNSSEIGAALLVKLPLVALNLSRCNISARDPDALTILIKSNIRWLDLSYNDLDTNGGRILSNFARQAYLNIHGNWKIPETLISTIEERVAGNPKLPNGFTKPFTHTSLHLPNGHLNCDRSIIEDHSSPPKKTF